MAEFGTITSLEIKAPTTNNGEKKPKTKIEGPCQKTPPEIRRMIARLYARSGGVSTKLLRGAGTGHLTQKRAKKSRIGPSSGERPESQQTIRTPRRHHAEGRIPKLSENARRRPRTPPT